MKAAFVFFLLTTMLAVGGCSRTVTTTTTSWQQTQSATSASPTPAIRLPEPMLKSEVSLEEALRNRRSIREYSEEPLSLAQVSQLLWAAQGLTADWGGRTAPSAGGLYPLEVYLVANSVEGLGPGAYKYRPASHELAYVKPGDIRVPLADAVLGQEWVKNGAAVIVIAAVFSRTVDKYGDRGRQYVWMEAGHAGQNICLEATALDLGAVPIGAFHDDQVQNVVGMPNNEAPLYVIPVGRKS